MAWKNLSNNKKIVYGFIAVVFVILAGRFLYYNVVVPWPHREDLQACLSEAETLGVAEEIEVARDVCFRTYPHFN